MLCAVAFLESLTIWVISVVSVVSVVVGAFVNRFSLFNRLIADCSVMVGVAVLRVWVFIELASFLVCL